MDEVLDYFRQNPNFALVLAAVVIWSAVWKAVALWKAARNSDKAWFVALFILNTAGILEIFYIFIFSRRGPAPMDGKERNDAII